MRRMVEANDAQERNEAELAEYARQDERDARRIMAVHQEHQFEALHGVSQEQWQAAQQARADGLARTGWDPSQPVGTEHHPETLIDGGSLTPNSAQAAAAQAVRYGTVTGIDAQLSRNAAEAAAWNSPVIRRVRMAALEAEISRTGSDAAHHARSEIARQAGLPEQYYPEIRPRLAAGDW
jgi:hypothetical protein